MEPVIFHVDVNSAFLSWSAVERLRTDPTAGDLRDIPSAVGGDVQTRHGVITAKSIPAKKYHVQTGEPVVKALEKCPNLVMVSSDFKVYREFSHQLMAILRNYANAVEQVSIDEAYLDMTGAAAPVHVHSPKGGFYMKEAASEHIPGDVGTPVSDSKTPGADKPASGARLVFSGSPDSSTSCNIEDPFHSRANVPPAHADAYSHAQGTGSADRFLSSSDRLPFPLNIADRIREEVFHTLGFTVNVGISSNRLLAKTASDFVKPGRIHTLWPEEVPEKMWPMPIGELHGCGKKSAARLYDFGIRTIGDAAAADVTLLQSILGEKGGLYIHYAANGLSSSLVSEVRDDAKSYSNETTVPNDITYENYDNDAPAVIHRLSESVARRLQRDGVFAGTIEFSVKTDDFRRHSRQMKLPESTNDPAAIEAAALQLSHQLLFGPVTGSAAGLFARGRKVRLIGVGGTSLDRGEYRQLDLFGYAREKEQEEKQAEATRAKAARQKQLDDMVAAIRRKYGDQAVTTGRNVTRGQVR